MSRALALSFVSLSLIAGCGGAMSMDRGPVPVVESPPVATPSAPVVDSAQIAEELARRPQLPSRPRVAVYFEPPSAGEAIPWRWSFEERQAIVRAGEDRHQLDLFALPATAARSSDLATVRLTAARYGAEAVIVVHGAYEQRRRENLWAATYVLLLPIFFAPAQEQETVFVVEATMFDVRNGYTYLAAEGEASQSQQRAHVWIRGEEGIDTSRHVAVRLLAGELAERFASIRPADVREVEARAAEPAAAPREEAPAQVGAEPVIAE